MRKQWKLAWRMLKYAYGIKGNLAMLIIFGTIGFLFGFDFVWIFDGRFQTAGMLYFAITSGFVAQMWQSLNVCGVLRSSPYKKAADTTIPVMFNVTGMLTFYTLAVIVTAVQGRAGDVRQAWMLLWMAACCFFIMLMFGAAYKYFVASMLLFFVFYFAGELGFLLLIPLSPQISFPAAVATGYALILCGAAGQYAISLLLYKKDASRMAQALPLRKYIA